MVRQRSHNELLSEICEIQAKDVPIMCLTFEFRDENSTLYTNDESFAEFSPSDHNLPAIEMEYVETEEREADSNFYGQHLTGGW